MTVPIQIKTLPTPKTPSSFSSEKFISDCEQLGLQVTRTRPGVWRVSGGEFECDYAPFAEGQKLSVRLFGSTWHFYEGVTPSLVIEIALGIFAPDELDSWPGH